MCAAAEAQRARGTGLQVQLTDASQRRSQAHNGEASRGRRASARFDAAHRSVKWTRARAERDGDGDERRRDARHTRITRTCLSLTPTPTSTSTSTRGDCATRGVCAGSRSHAARLVSRLVSVSSRHSRLCMNYLAQRQRRRVNPTSTRAGGRASRRQCSAHMSPSRRLAALERRSRRPRIAARAARRVGSQL